MATFDVAIVGSGVIGLSSAWQLSNEGLKVALFDPHPGRGSSYVAAGMLAPVTEAAWGEEPLIEINVRSAEMWASFDADLRAASGYATGYRASGTLLVGADRSDRAYLEELLDFQQHLSLASSWRGPTACRELEPMLSPNLAGGIFAPQDHQVNNRRLLVALDQACRNNGVTIDKRRVDSVISANGSVSGIEVDGEQVAASVVVVAAGAASNRIGGLSDFDLPPVRSVKGQILRLHAPTNEPFMSRSIRAIVQGHSVYVVPRADGQIALGATVEEQGDDLTVTAGAVYELLRDATRILPGLSEIELTEATAGHRPGSPDNAPIVGASSLPGLIYATGHYRNGILLAPTTAQAVVEVVTTGSLPSWAKPFDPYRFVRAAARADQEFSQTHPVAS